MIFGIILSHATITKDILAEHILFLSNNARVCHIFVQQKSKIIWVDLDHEEYYLFFGNFSFFLCVWDLDSFLFEATMIFICQDKIINDVAMNGSW